MLVIQHGSSAVLILYVPSLFTFIFASDGVDTAFPACIIPPISVLEEFGCVADGPDVTTIGFELVVKMDPMGFVLIMALEEGHNSSSRNKPNGSSGTFLENKLYCFVNKPPAGIY